MSSLSAYGPGFLALRPCMREPISAIFQAADLLSQAADAHKVGAREEASRLLAAADIPEVRAWTDSLWGSRKNHPDQWTYHRYRSIEGPPPHVPKDQRVPIRMPTTAEKSLLIQLRGRHCCFCGIPLVRVEVRKAFQKWYPDVVPWGGATHSQHAAFQCLWMQFDHVLPHSRGGDSAFENLVLTCAGCNFGRMQWTVEELGLGDPRTRPAVRSDWDGLERVFQTR